MKKRDCLQLKIFLPVAFSSMKMSKEKQVTRGPSKSHMDLKDPDMDMTKIMKDIELFSASHMTWKERKELENRKVVALGGKPPKKQRLPLSVARVVMKKQKEREEKMSRENRILKRFGAYSSGGGSGGSSRMVEKRKPEDRALKISEGSFRNGILDVGSLLRSNPSRDSDAVTRAISQGREKKSGGGGRGGGKKKKGKSKGRGKKRH